MNTLPYRAALKDGEVELSLLSDSDKSELLAFARRLPIHDLLFLSRDITRTEAVDVWIDEVRAGTKQTIVAREQGEIVGYASVRRSDREWSAHVAELRLMAGPTVRGRGVGRILINAAFALAVESGIEKIFGYMTLDQKGARTLFEELGFRPEALLRDEVKDRNGQKHDVLRLATDVRETLLALDLAMAGAEV
jgi:L-amino acid N-acyltransferase YncA